ncbi:hypothetical protein HH310_38440 [Actinoplanes sp. TBRC 11911]|uniref:hypothetical protein n=1 Tax=Actinoplanes sp. TBRC 11911 TaxID=2729386 RepID=UPI00145FA06F|nr:hypothetical protein [Actinoplanes sp. TBRC 11911]NMO57044.1 hypothetical protein [Actinoplanes sp. TBRC 11911]
MSTLIFDPALMYAEVTPLISALTRRDWAGCRTVLDAAPATARTRLIVLGGEQSDLDGFLRGVLREAPDDGAAAAMLGSHLTTVAWQIRSRKQAQFVGRDQFRAFHEMLAAAEEVLVDGAARNPADAAMWTARMPTARGLELGQPEARRRYDRLSAVEPNHLPAQEHLLQQLCPKWGGTWETAFTFARDAMRAAPPGSPNAVLVAEAHLERWVDANGSDAYMRSAEVIAELHEAAQTSIWHAGFGRAHGWVRVLSTFAMVFSLADDQPAAERVFAALGGFATKRPWDYLGDPAAVVRERRRRAGIG